ncbi:hypothetical protein ABZ654_26420 [Streptomyces hygroscopicus]|uniref:hypothetical protein n=1 Tax=Streptomyces hygroscopicus TaxID=1912 RepID=UPI0033E9E42F
METSSTRTNFIQVIRVSAVTAVAALALGATSGMASATEYDHARTEQAKVQAEVATAMFEAAEAPEIEYDGLEERFANLPDSPSMEQIVAAMYPGDEARQAQALAGLDNEGKPGWSWSKAWKITKCVASIGAFIAGNAVLVSKLKKLGGIYKGAKLVVEAGNFQERMKALAGIFGAVTGLGVVASSCG